MSKRIFTAPPVPGFGLGNKPQFPFGDESSGIGALQGRSMTAPVRSGQFVGLEEDNDVANAAAARRARLAQALVDRARDSYEGAGKTGAWNALPGIAEAISAWFGEK